MDNFKKKTILNENLNCWIKIRRRNQKRKVKNINNKRRIQKDDLKIKYLLHQIIEIWRKKNDNKIGIQNVIDLNNLKISVTNLK